ncbi:hypothetical protein [Mucilaginibacter celer]|uniref:Uncharacterized protein n=1 Tax=Mucilaginibacter celer TaxID=2305508 RepID=A0A494VM45_9SPHI|nr:hypothetical protein [Mucilaginibacter celer]AYL96357.1 hypothetical protein HYN43_014100 [Mucilaginibacter celer]
MAASNIKKIGKRSPETRHQHTNAWQVMKPFVHFGIKATAAIAHTLIAIVKHIPKPGRNDAPKHGSKKVIKI